MNITIRGIEYKPIDTPIDVHSKGYVINCIDCDIYKARPPITIMDVPLCYEWGNMRAQRECATQFRKGVHRVWKKVNKEDMTNPIKDNRIVNDMTFAIRLYNFIKQTNVCDAASEEEQEYLMRVAKRLFDYQKQTATQKGEIDYLKRIEYDKSATDL